MIVGINFTGKHADYDALEVERKVSRLPKRIAQQGGMTLILQGVCTTEREMKAMIIQASNGRREVVGKPIESSRFGYAVYCS